MSAVMWDSQNETLIGNENLTTGNLVMSKCKHVLEITLTLFQRFLTHQNEKVHKKLQNFT